MSSDDEIDDESMCAQNETLSCQTKTTDEIVNVMNKHIKEVTEIIKSICGVQMPITTMRIVLGYTKWDKQGLLDRLTDEENRDTLFEKAHVLNPFAKNNKPSAHNHTMQRKCNICSEELSQDEIVGLGCGHIFCKGCWFHTVHGILEVGDVDSIHCPDVGCGVVVDDDIVISFLDGNTKQKYQRLMTRSFIEHIGWCWCPSPGCNLAVKADCQSNYQQNLKCQCGQNFCFGCGDESHDPIPCNLMKHWKNDVHTNEYLLMNTKCCPKCDSRVQNIYDRNFVKCVCACEFCWYCFKIWEGPEQDNDHMIRCSDKTPEDQNPGRYGSHKGWSKNDLERFSQICDMGKSGEAQFLMEAIEILIESRKQLMLSYIFGYYVKAHFQKLVLQFNQSSLDQEIVALSQYFNWDITKDSVEEIKIKQGACKYYQRIMQKHICEGFEKGWWTFLSPEDEMDDKSMDAENEPPSFQIMSIDEIVVVMKEFIKEVALFVGPRIGIQMPATTMRILLGYTKWNKQELLERLKDEENRDTFFKTALVPNPFAENNGPPVHNHTMQRKCNTCSKEISQDEIVSLGCGHIFCKGCWLQAVDGILEIDDADSIHCPSVGCGIIVDDDIVINFLDENTKQKYQRLMIKSFIERNGWCLCPSPGCSLAVKADRELNYQQNRKCRCGHNFCSNCGDESHDPIPCNLIKHWKNDVDWMDDEHEDPRGYYLERYRSHKWCSENDLKHFSEIQNMGKSAEVQFLMDAIEILMESRKQLLLSYIFGYYVTEYPQKSVLQLNQSILDQAIQDLSQLFDKDITNENVKEIETKMSGCERRQKVIQNHMFEGFEKGLWTFLEPAADP